MKSARKMLVSGVRILTRDGAELEPGAGIEWTLHLWLPGHHGPQADFTIGKGSLVDGSEGLVPQERRKGAKVTRVTL
jgi:hypothetical protein